MGFKSRIMPAIEVLRTDGVRCRGYMRKSTNGVNGITDPTAVGDSMSSNAPTSAASSAAIGPYSTFSKLA